jgi:hypothetical protein
MSILTPLSQETGGKINTETSWGQTTSTLTTPDGIEVMVADEDGGVSISVAPDGVDHADCMLGEYNPQTGSYTIFTDKDDAIRTILEAIVAERFREALADEIAEIAPAENYADVSTNLLAKTIENGQLAPDMTVFLSLCDTENDSPLDFDGIDYREVDNFAYRTIEECWKHQPELCLAFPQECQRITTKHNHDRPFPTRSITTILVVGRIFYAGMSHLNPATVGKGR